MNKIEREIRNILSDFSIEKREDGSEGRTITGYAIVFNQESVDLGFRETILPGAVTEEIINNSDILFTWQHNPNWCLARQTNGEGNIEITIDEHGVKFRFDVPNTTVGNDLLELIRTGVVRGCSFAFTVDPSDPEAEKWEEKDGVYHRYIHKINRLYDFSCVVTPAYEGTSVSARSMESLENFKKELQEQRDKEAEKAEQERVDALNKKYSTMLTEIDLM